MTLRLRTLGLALGAATVLGGPAHALDGVVASLKPIHSLVAAVMDGVGEPSLIVRGAGSGHTYTMRPSDAAALQDAKVVFWAGPGMENFLAGPLKTLAASAEAVALVDAPGQTLLGYREGGPFEAHSHGDHDHDHSHDHDDHHGHDHGEHDMHFWLDPENAKAMLAQIETTLGAADPANAGRYEANAQAYAARLDALSAEIAAQVEPVADKAAIVFHDAYQYFEHRFGVNVVGSITVSPETMPGAQRVAEIRQRIIDTDAGCVFAEPQFEPRLVSVVTEGTPAKAGVLDPLGADLEDGPELYIELLRNLSTSFATCLAGEG